MNKLKSKLVKKLTKKTINEGVLICIDCGSILTLMEKTRLKCKECGATRRINK